MASLDDILTTQKNGVVTLGDLVNELALFRQIYSQSVGTQAALNATTPVLVTTGSGRLVNVYVNTAGSSAGTIHDASSVATASAANVLFSVPNTVGVTVVSIPYSAGLVIQPGTGQVINITYS